VASRQIVVQAGLAVTVVWEAAVFDVGMSADFEPAADFLECLAHFWFDGGVGVEAQDDFAIFQHKLTKIWQCRAIP
jgi:hypothetical protein